MHFFTKTFRLGFLVVWEIGSQIKLEHLFSLNVCLLLTKHYLGNLCIVIDRRINFSVIYGIFPLKNQQRLLCNLHFCIALHYILFSYIGWYLLKFSTMENYWKNVSTNYKMYCTVHRVQVYTALHDAHTFEYFTYKINICQSHKNGIHIWFKFNFRFTFHRTNLDIHARISEFAAHIHTQTNNHINLLNRIVANRFNWLSIQKVTIFEFCSVF